MPDLKLPLQTRRTSKWGDINILDNSGAILITVWDYRAITGASVTPHFAEVIVAALTEDAENQARFAACAYEHSSAECGSCGWWPDAEDAESTPAVVIPSVDYTKIPQEYAGKWVLIRIKDQEVVSAADNPQDAMRGFDSGDNDLVLTKVPIYRAEDAERREDG